MMGAVVRFCEGLGPPPAELTRLLSWRTWKILPNAGGQRDQVAGELERMIVCGNYYDAWKVKQDQKLAFMSMNEDTQRLLAEMSRWVLENEPSLVDWRVRRWARFG